MFCESAFSDSGAEPLSSAFQQVLHEIYLGMATNSFTYNAAGDLLTLTDGKNQVTSWNYDSNRGVIAILAESCSVKKLMPITLKP